MNDYERVARIIRYLDAHYDLQPNLHELASAAGLSPYHFHRLFTRWAGVTPKDFLQCLTAEHARARLRKGQSVLHTALESGLSGPGRLHDLLVTLHAASPGEVKSGGKDLEIGFGFAESPFGDCLVGQTARGVCHLSFVVSRSERGAAHAIRSDWPRARLVRCDEDALRIVKKAFGREAAAGPSRPLSAWVKGSPFQIRVWKALLRVPSGSLSTYSRIAEAIGTPGAARAVGIAVGSNPVAYLIPCHRVIRETGIVGGYRWNPDRKRALIAWESARNRVPGRDPV